MLFTEDEFSAACEDGRDVFTNYKWCMVYRQYDTAQWDEYFEECSRSWGGYHVFHIQYNHLTFNGAADHISKFTLLTSPYLLYSPEDLKNLAAKYCPQYKKSVYDVLTSKHFPDVWDSSITSVEEIFYLSNLPNGWTSDVALAFLGGFAEVERQFARPSSGLAMMRGMLASGHTILHPWKPRPLTDEELTAIMVSDFTDRLAEALEAAEVTEGPLQVLVWNVDLTSTVPAGYKTIVKNSFTGRDLPNKPGAYSK